MSVRSVLVIYSSQESGLRGESLLSKDVILAHV